jgi:phage shock protein A
MTDNTDLTQATDTINAARTGAIQEHQILTINDQIVGHDNEIAAAEQAIDAMQDQIKKLRRDIKRREKEQVKLRLQRDIFARAAFELKQVGMP